MKIDYIRVSEESWEEVKESALTTVHKKYTGTEITHEWKTKIIKSEHSPIRELVVRAKFVDVPRFVADQLVRHHIGVQPQMGTWREDRGNKPRSEQRMDEPTVLRLTLNAQAILNISQERLCIGCVSPETRELWETFLDNLRPLEPELVYHCVPSCVYRCGCKEFNPCNHFHTFINFITDEFTLSGMRKVITDINHRYGWYHTFRNN